MLNFVAFQLPSTHARIHQATTRNPFTVPKTPEYSKFFKFPHSDEQPTPTPDHHEESPSLSLFSMASRDTLRGWDQEMASSWPPYKSHSSQDPSLSPDSISTLSWSEEKAVAGLCTLEGHFLLESVGKAYSVTWSPIAQSLHQNSHQDLHCHAFEWHHGPVTLKTWYSLVECAERVCFVLQPSPPGPDTDPPSLKRHICGRIEVSVRSIMAGEVLEHGYEHAERYQPTICLYCDQKQDDSFGVCLYYEAYE
ncbi:hypothetical protein V8B97DRAFT_1920327 [Scleroderma yunnanense]